jgi:hypothetical protein
MMHGRQLEVNNVNQKNPKLNNSHHVFFRPQKILAGSGVGVPPYGAGTQV